MAVYGGEAPPPPPSCRIHVGVWSLQWGGGGVGARIRRRMVWRGRPPPPLPACACPDYRPHLPVPSTTVHDRTNIEHMVLICGWRGEVGAMIRVPVVMAGASPPPPLPDCARAFQQPHLPLPLFNSARMHGYGKLLCAWPVKQFSLKRLLLTICLLLWAYILYVLICYCELGKRIVTSKLGTVLLTVIYVYAIW